MLVIITGGSASGKSDYAEKAAICQARKQKSGTLHYLATMFPYDEECKKRIQKHQRMRQEKGFHTIECYYEIGTIVEQVRLQDVVLLECMSNLLANELYMGSGKIEEDIVEPILQLVKQGTQVIVVTNEVFSNGEVYAEETKRYLQTLGRLNERLGTAAEIIIEVVCSIPVRIKGELPC